MGSMFICLKCSCPTFNLWRCVKQTKCNCNFDHQNLSRGKPSSNHRQFAPLMMVRDLIHPGEKQIKALLSPACRHTIAYINILSWVIQVSKGLIHLHFHKSPLSTLWPPSHLPLLPTSTCCPLLHLTGPPPFTFPPPSIHLAVSAIIPIITIFIRNWEHSSVLILFDTDGSLADRQCGEHFEKQK